MDDGTSQKQASSTVPVPVPVPAAVPADRSGSKWLTNNEMPYLPYFLLRLFFFFFFFFRAWLDLAFPEARLIFFILLSSFFINRITCQTLMHAMPGIVITITLTLAR